MQKLEFCSKKDTDKNLPIGKENAIKLPANESQVRPLIECLNHDGERLHVWQLTSTRTGSYMLRKGHTSRHYGELCDVQRDVARMVDTTSMTSRKNIFQIGILGFLPRFIAQTKKAVLAGTHRTRNPRRCFFCTLVVARIVLWLLSTK